MKDAAIGILDAILGLVSGPLAVGLVAVKALVSQVTLPDGDPQWARVLKVIEDTARNISDASQLDVEAQDAVKAAVVHRATVELKNLGLLEGI